MTIGERIQKARKAAKLSQKELGEKLGVSASMIGQYENNLRNPKTETLFRLAEALNVNPRELGHNHIFFFSDYTFLPADEDSTILRQGSYPKETESSLIHAFRKLNEEGKEKAIERVEELAEIQKYQARKDDFSHALGDTLSNNPDIRDAFVSSLASIPDEALPVIAEYIRDVAKDPQGYLRQSASERQEQVVEFTKKIATAIIGSE